MLHWDQNWVDAHHEKWKESDQKANRFAPDRNTSASSDFDSKEALASGFVWGVLLALFVSWSAGTPTLLNGPPLQASRVEEKNLGDSQLDLPPLQVESILNPSPAKLPTIQRIPADEATRLEPQRPTKRPSRRGQP